MDGRYTDRRQAGRALAARLSHLASRDDVVVLGLPRGGVPVAFEVANALKAPLDVFVVRKLGVPGQEELAMGAIAGDGVEVLNQEVIRYLDVDRRQIDAVKQRELVELERRQRLYRGHRKPVQLAGKTVVIVDDGLATGSTMRAAVEAVRKSEPARIVIAAPVAAADTVQQFEAEVDEVVCPLTPHRFHAVGLWYEVFDQTSDEEVRDLLQRSGGGGVGDTAVR